MRWPAQSGNRILWLTVAPVLAAGLILVLVVNSLLLPPLSNQVEEEINAQLLLASQLALNVLDDKMGYLLEMHLEDKPDVQAALQREAMQEIHRLKDWFPKLDLMVVDDKGFPLMHTGGSAAALTVLPSTESEDLPQASALGNREVLVNARYFPLWRWRVVSLIGRDEYTSASRRSQWAVIMATTGILLVVIATLVAVFSKRVSGPLKGLLQATREVAHGARPVLPIASRDELGQLVQAFNGMVQSIEESRERVDRVLAQLVDSEERYRLVTERSLALIMVIQNERMVFANQKVAEVLNTPLEDILGRNVADLIPSEEWDKIVRRSSLRDTNLDLSDHFEFRVVDRRGKARWLEMLATNIPYQGSRAILGHAVEITLRKEAQQQEQELRRRLEHSQKMEVIGTLSGGVAHDFNNILQVIGGHVQLAQREAPPVSAQARHLKGVQEAAERGSKLVRQLLTFGRRVRPNLEPLDLNSVVEQSADILRHTIPREIEVEVSLAQDLLRIMADNSQVEQVLLNLGSNARDAMPRGGRMSFSTRNLDLTLRDTAGYANLKPGRYVHLSVSDTGLGMDSHTLEHMFEPFFTTKEVGKGTGLGLSIVYGMVKSHGGLIKCESRSGRGSSFNLYFPALTQVKVDAKPAVQPRQAPGGRERILLVDDEEPIRAIGRELLESFGYQVHTASCGEEALTIHETINGGFDLVVLDLSMPGMGGRACLEALLTRDPSLKVIISSGYAAGGETEASLASGAAAFLPKPYRHHELLTLIRSTLDGLTQAAPRDQPQASQV